MPAPCRVCTDFQTWASSVGSDDQMQSKHQSSGSSGSGTNQKDQSSSSSTLDISSAKISTTEKSSEKLECPPDSQQLGSSTWTFLHTMASYYPDEPDVPTQQAAVHLMDSLAQLYPCSWCAKHLRKELIKHPAQVKSRTALEQWMCELHNEVNERLGKPAFDCSRVRERWRDGCQ
jgi:FAD-linked sulfhydryl oxidase